MILKKRLFPLMLYFISFVNICSAADDVDFSAVPLLGATGSPLRTLTDVDNDSDVEDRVVEQLEGERQKNAELGVKLAEKNALVARQLEAVTTLKADIQVYENALRGNLDPLNKHIAKYNAQLSKLKEEYPQDTKIPAIEEKIAKLESLHESRPAGAAAGADDTALTALRAQLQTAQDKLEAKVAEECALLEDFNSAAAVQRRSGINLAIQRLLDTADTWFQ